VLVVYRRFECECICYILFARCSGDVWLRVKS
jgi:hypothetical protein